MWWNHRIKDPYVAFNKRLNFNLLLSWTWIFICSTSSLSLVKNQFYFSDSHCWENSKLSDSSEEFVMIYKVNHLWMFLVRYCPLNYDYSLHVNVYLYISMSSIYYMRFLVLKYSDVYLWSNRYILFASLQDHVWANNAHHFH